MSNEPTVRRRALGRALRMARTAAGLTQSAVAENLGCGQGKINKIETTIVTIKSAELDKMLELYGVSAERADELRALALSEGPLIRVAPQWSAFEELFDQEPDAAEIRCWHSERIPRHLQSELYMLRHFDVNRTKDADVTKLMRNWKARARIFTIDQPPYYRAILSESSLLRIPCGRPDLIVDQIEHMLDLLRRHERLTLQILPFDADIPFVDTDFVILRFPDERAALGYSECPAGSRTFRDIDGLVEHWNDLRSAALSEDESVLFMERVAQQARERRDPN